jgi:hypothetical protein
MLARSVAQGKDWRTIPSSSLAWTAVASFVDACLIARGSIVALWTACPGVQLASLVVRWVG